MGKTVPWSMSPSSDTFTQFPTHCIHLWAAFKLPESAPEKRETETDKARFTLVSRPDSNAKRQNENNIGGLAKLFLPARGHDFGTNENVKGVLPLVTCLPQLFQSYIGSCWGWGPKITPSFDVRSLEIILAHLPACNIIRYLKPILWLKMDQLFSHPRAKPRDLRTTSKVCREVERDKSKERSPRHQSFVEKSSRETIGSLSNHP